MSSEASSTTNKRGRLSQAEEKYILDHKGSMSAAQIAAHLHRTPDVVKGVIEGRAGSAAQQKVNLRGSLRGSAEWVELRKQFSAEEIRYFEERYETWMSQFKDDVLASEETQIFMLIKNEILMNRNLAEKQRAAEDIVRMQTMLDGFYGRFATPAEMDESSREQAVQLNEQITASHSAQQARTTEFIKLQEKHADLMKQLKATRDQRLKRIENSKVSFIDVIKDLMLEENRKLEGEQMELMRMAAETVDYVPPPLTEAAP